MPEDTNNRPGVLRVLAQNEIGTPVIVIRISACSHTSRSSSSSTCQPSLSVGDLQAASRRSGKALGCEGCHGAAAGIANVQRTYEVLCEWPHPQYRTGSSSTWRSPVGGLRWMAAEASTGGSVGWRPRTHIPS